MAYNLGYARYVVSSAVLSLKTAPAAGMALPNGTKSCLIQNVDPANTLAWNDEPSVPPSATEGMQLGPGQSLIYDGDPNDLRFCRAGAADVNSIRVGYYSA